MDTKISTLSISLLFVILCGCNGGETLDYKLKSGTKYKIQKEDLVVLNEFEMNSNYEFQMEVNDLSNIVIQLVDSDYSTNKSDINELQTVNDLAKKGPNHCISEDSKTIKSNIRQNRDTDVRTAMALDSWNLQAEFPNTQLNVGDTYTNEIPSNDNSDITIRDYILDSINNQIAYLSFNEFVRYENEAMNIGLNSELSTIKTGRLEYDLNHHHYRLIHTQQKYTGPEQKHVISSESESAKIKDRTLRSNMESTIRISKLD